MEKSSKKWKLAGAIFVGAAVFAAFLAVLRARRNPSPYSPPGFSFEIPRPFLTRRDLLDILAPRPGERLLEVGPGKGYYSLEVARQLAPDGSLDILDLQPEMLDHTIKRARSEGVSNISATRSDASELPYPDDAFDGAYLVAVLGEISDKERAMSELRRVVKSGGRVVFGEAITDPHRVSPDALRELAEDAGFRFELSRGGVLGAFHRFGG